MSLPRPFSLVFTLVFAFCSPAHGANDAAGCATQSGVNAVVGDVAADGTLLLVDGARVRLAGVLLGDAAASDRQAARQVLAALAKGNPVELHGIPEKGQKTDRYGRLPAQVFVRHAGSMVWLQGELVSQGLARAFALKDNYNCAATLVALEGGARARRAGYWRSGVFALHAARDVARLNELLDTYQIVEGQILSVGQVRREFFLNFGRRWKEDFTVIVPAPIAERLAGRGVVLKALEGRRVRIRGFLLQRGGPAIELETEEQLDVLGQD